MGKVVISKYQPQYISKKFGVSSSEAAIDPLRSLVVFSHHRSKACRPKCEEDYGLRELLRGLEIWIWP
uniref:Uncharacterized protein n=1 Tax=Vitis vinifera TaxID=29760 RepID=F6H2I2_VITVI